MDTRLDLDTSTYSVSSNQPHFNSIVKRLNKNRKKCYCEKLLKRKVIQEINS